MNDSLKGRVTIEGRTFQLEFWTETHFNLPYASVAEIKMKESKLHWFSKKTEMREVVDCIDSGWMVGNRLEWCMKRIARYLQREKDEIEELRQIEAFCNMKGTDK